MRKLIYSLAALVVVMASVCFADQEYLSDFKEKSVPVVNEEIRKIRQELVNLQTDMDSISVHVPTGTILLWSASSLPSGGYLECDGSAVSRTTYSALFAVIGTTWGSGDGSTTFNIPDLRGRAPIGAGTGSGLTARTLAASGGEETHTMTISELVPHTHTTRAVTTTGSGTSGLAKQTHDFSENYESSSTGSGTAFNVMQPYKVVKFIIKT